MPLKVLKVGSKPSFLVDRFPDFFKFNLIFLALKMEFLPAQCASQSVGLTNNLFGLLLQTIIAAQCGLKDEWPKDHGPTALENGKI